MQEILVESHMHLSIQHNGENKQQKVVLWQPV